MANSTAPERVDYLWFPDADLVLRAENSMFRVSSGILAARSSVFRDMTTLPQPMPLEDETVDGCIVVRLHDSAAEAKCFLRAIFDSSFFMPPPSTVLLTTVIGVMRLAHKYHIPYLFRRALSHLDVLYPTTLSEFQTSTSPFPGPFRKYHHIIPDAEPVSLVRAVSEVGALWLLPAAYYSWINELPPSSDAFNNLQPDELRLCWAAQLQCIRAVGITYRFLRNLPGSSCNSTDCIDLICHAQDAVDHWSELQNGNSALDLDPLGPWIFSYPSNRQLCSMCETVGRHLFIEAQKQVWEHLPGMFALPMWKQLIEMRQKVSMD
ncbi:BTB domain-containing protein [Favolaschia claudopus]|uniref:BTB domain-containing protein n=1 Tax=Favolaschia claudopus TaxID=2862362 RepID=A0AAW0AK57_9AGAR